MNELSQLIAELKRCGETLVGLSASLAGLLTTPSSAGPTTPPEAVYPLPESKPIELETVRAALAEKSRAGYTAEVRALLNTYGAARLSEVMPTDYADLLAAAEGLGHG